MTVGPAAERPMLDRRKVRDHRGHHPWRTMGMLITWRVDLTFDLPADHVGLTRHDEKRVLTRDGQIDGRQRVT